MQDCVSKGQLISKRKFSVVNSSEKRTKEFQFLPKPTRAKLSHSFFGRIEDTTFFFYID